MKTNRMTLHLSDLLNDDVEVGVDPRFGGRSNRVNGMLERFIGIIDENIGCKNQFSADEQQMLQAAYTTDGKSGKWLRKWTLIPCASDAEAALKARVFTLTEAQISSLEEWLARTGRKA